MRHEHLLVTVEADTKADIEADLDGGETVEAWIADAIETKLDAAEREEENAAGETEAVDRTDRTDREERDERRRSDDGERWVDGRTSRDGGTDGFDDYGDGNDGYGDDDYDEGFQYVDDCSI
ncbi:MULTISPECIES: hypothetical protein [Halorussus]|uniref:hypothetical protein n=1 Tax=Halorussus TaxID=1070314 RepID=UPI00209F7E60|nr:hypothetical protein [Halorussus vallis]USZ74806.1 hypothetical protein NGM07_15350 [Halorussus vallis]